MPRGQHLLATLAALPAELPAAAFLRHAERHHIADVSDPTKAELTDAGVATATTFGASLRGFGCLRLFHSPVKRCRQTAEAIAAGAQTAGMQVEIVGPEDALGIDYILDYAEAGRLTLLHGEGFVRQWFSGQVAPTVIRAAEQIAALKLRHLRQHLSAPCTAGRRLDLHVSHDWNILVLRELLVGVRHEEAGWLNYLDGVVFVPTAAGLRAIYRDAERLVPVESLAS